MSSLTHSDQVISPPNKGPSQSNVGKSTASAELSRQNTSLPQTIPHLHNQYLFLSQLFFDWSVLKVSLVIDTKEGPKCLRLSSNHTTATITGASLIWQSPHLHFLLMKPHVTSRCSQEPYYFIFLRACSFKRSPWTPESITPISQLTFRRS